MPVARLRRIALNTLAAMPLLLCLAACAMWVRSYRRVDSLIRFHVKHQQTQMWIDRESTVTFRSGRVYEADSRRGILRLLWLDSDGTYDRTEYPARVSYPLVEEEQDSRGVAAWRGTRLGFAVERRPVDEIIYNAPPGWQAPAAVTVAYVIHAVYTPWWAWATVFALPHCRRIARMVRRASRRRRRLCVFCGYDLRASPGRCPECGVAPKGSLADSPKDL